MRKIKLFLLLLFMQMFGFLLFAQEAEKPKEIFKIGIEVRPRLEYFHGYKTLVAPDQDHGLSISQRSRINLDFKNENFITRLSLQDVRIWGNQIQLVGNEDFASSIHEAWAEAVITKSLSLKFGRQEIIYDDHRIFGSVNWAQQARSHDAAIIKYKSAGFKAELALAYNQDGAKLSGTNNAVNPKNYKAFQNLWMNYKASDQFNISFLFLNNGKQLETGGDAYSQTVGPRITFNNKTIAAHGTFYYQGGVNNNQTVTGSAQKVNASYFGADISYKFSKSFSALLGFERLSGDSQLETNEETKVFMPFYGTNHKFNGHMDYFYVGSGHGNVGLQDIYLQLNAKLPKVAFGLHTHMLSAAADVADPNDGTAMSKGLGTEIDLFFSFKLTKGVSFKGGYSQMFAKETMEAVKGGSRSETSNWAYAMILFKPTLFEHKK
ncbi:MAG: hypothetical protein DRI95_09730 [Bacteroidetes bacterium]|nr:MAG: hypothetical protein DRI95_09730 [Bacteroidota bacterium]